jgi:hypothetical protein
MHCQHSGFDRRVSLRGVLAVHLFIVACTSTNNDPGARGNANLPSSGAYGGATNDNSDGRRSAAAAGNGGSPNGSDDSVQVPRLFPPELVGPLVGPEAAPIPGLQLFGADLGWTFVHRGRHTILFGDTMSYATVYCDNHDPKQDDGVATLPLSPPSGVPPLSFVTVPGDSSQYAPLRLNRGGTVLPTGLGSVPSTAWSDGQHAFAVIGHLEPTLCKPDANSELGCDPEAGLTCVHDVGTCSPPIGPYPAVCDVTTAQGCVLGQQCVVPDEAYCVDLTSSQYDGTQNSVPFSMAQNTELAVQHDDDPSAFDSVYTFASTKFNMAVARTVSRLSDRRRDDDFTPGTGALLMWGRAGFSGEHGRQSQLYLLKHTLPLPVRSDGTVAFAPQFFAGVDPESGEPRWSPAQRDAVAIAMDGKRNGSPAEPIIVVAQFSMSWLGPPVNKWMMLYGGDVPDNLLVDPNAANAQGTRGPLRVRFADWPWGPFSPAQEYLSPGSPSMRGAPYGPGGFLYHSACLDQPDAPCARTDPVRPVDSTLPGCPTPAIQLDIGRLYGVNIIDAYTQPSPEGGLVVTWNVSTWNPYGVVLMRSRVAP